MAEAHTQPHDSSDTPSAEPSDEIELEYVSPRSPLIRRFFRWFGIRSARESRDDE